MIATNFGARILAFAAAGAVLAGCDSIKDVRDAPSTPLPAQQVVLKGTVSNLSSKRSVTLRINSTLSNGTIGVLAPPPTELNEELNGVTPFAFPAFPAGTAYNVEVMSQPRGKNCVVTSGGTGILTAGVDAEVEVQCTNTGNRYDMTVNLNPAFSSAEGAEVVLTTEEAIYRINPAPTATSVTFEDVLFNPGETAAPPPATQPAGFNWSVVASNTIGGTLNKCPVTNPTNVVGTTITNPTGNISNVSVGACTFTIGGTVSYSAPVVGGVAGPTPPPPTGLVIELRNLGEDTIRTQAYSGAWDGTFRFTDNGTDVQFVSNRNAIYSVKVNTHPAGMYCVVVDPMAILYAPTLTTNPGSISSPKVQCREVPTPDRQLKGVYRHMTSIWQRNNTAPIQTVTYDPLDFTKQNTASSNGIALFENGTYIYGTHANITQLEHGFYDYDPVAGTLRFTLNVDTNPNAVFPSVFSPANANSASTIPTTTAGLSAVPGVVTVGGFRHATLTNVNTATAGQISGTFVGSQAIGPLASTANGNNPVATATETNASLGWVLEAPPSITGQMTGAWAAQDSRRLWIFDRETYYGFHAGVVGVSAVNDACFTMPDLSVSSGLYTRRPSINGCYPWPRPQPGQSPAYTFQGIVESIDLKVPQFIGSGAGSVDISTRPEYMARLPGAAQAADGRSPSPMYFHIAPAASFYDEAPAQYFPAAPTDWCDTEILGIRASLNAVPIHKPVYFCRSVP
ncbi:MAG TPA: hypothetical protein VNQ32_12195 [Steroidobacteraceae bacterium]|nr:hypothetical protein [Steroidobacteraceae bacterium]